MLLPYMFYNNREVMFGVICRCDERRAPRWQETHHTGSVWVVRQGEDGNGAVA